MYLCVCMGVLVAQSCPPLCDPMNCSLLDSSVHGILQARILEYWSGLLFPSPGVYTHTHTHTHTYVCMSICMYVSESFYTIQQKLTQHGKSITLQFLKNEYKYGFKEWKIHCSRNPCNETHRLHLAGFLKTHFCLKINWFSNLKKTKISLYSPSFPN